MRLVYLEEAGTGKIEKDPHTVVAGVIVNADRQYKAIEKYLSDMAEEHFPGRRDVVFHAKDMWHGAGIFSRQIFPDKWGRRRILLEICGLVEKFDMPVVWGYSDRAALIRRRPEFSSADALVGSLAISAFGATVSAERYLRRFGSEVASITYENNNISKKIIKEVHNYWKHPHDEDLRGFPEWEPYLPFKKLIDVPNMAEKFESSILQIADAVAFAIARKLKNAEDCDYLFDSINRQFVMRHQSWGARPRKLKVGKRKSPRK